MSQSNNPFPSDQPQEIYAPPSESPETRTLCPRCGEEMEVGELYSSSIIKWRGNTQSPLKKFVSGGNPIAKTQSGFGCKYSAYHCEPCKLYTLAD